jgi:phosphate-selective porin OprO/OprP
VKSKTVIRAAMFAALSGIATCTALADDAELRKQLEALRSAMDEQRARIEAQTRLLETQQAQLDELTRQLAQPEAAAPEQKAATTEGPRIAFDNNRPTITAGDGGSSMAFRTNVQLDGAAYGEDPAGPLASDYRRGSVGGTPNRDNNAARDLSDGLVFRRARFGFEGTVARHWNYMLLFELGGSGTEASGRINDAWISYTGIAPFTFQLGAFAPPSNMDDSTSPEELLFLERAAASEISRSMGGADGRIGLAAKAGGKRWMSSLALTSRTAGDAEVHDTQTAVVARAGFLAATGSDYNVHLGASGTYVISPADLGPESSPGHPVRFRDRPEVRVDGVRLIDTGNIDADHASVYGLEFGATWKSLYLQGEHFWYDIERRASANLPDPDFSGYYLQGSWILTGESRRYNAAKGSFLAPRPRQPFSAGGGFGAWEFGARYSRMDLDYEQGLEGTAAAPGSVRGGDQSVITLGINWFPNNNIKVMLDYLMIDVERLNPAGPANTTPFGAAPNTPPIGVEIGQDLDVFALRTQFSF